MVISNSKNSSGQTITSIAKDGVVSKTFTISDGLNHGEICNISVRFGSHTGYTLNLLNGTANNVYAVYDERDLDAPNFDNTIKVTANNNAVTIGSNGKVVQNEAEDWDGDVKTVHIALGSANSNTATLNSGSVEGDIIAAQVEVGSASGNSAIVNSGEVRDVYGAEGFEADITNNLVEINGGEVRNVYGGVAVIGTVKGNDVNINGGIILGDVYGGCSEEDEDAYEATNVTVSDNVVTLENVNLTNFIFERQDEEILGSDYIDVGGHAYGGYSQKGDVTENEVILKSGDVYTLSGGHSDEGNAEGNSVTIENGSILYYCDDRAYCDVGLVEGGSTFDGDACENVVNIYGGTISTDVAGGVVEGSGTAYGNKVNISGGMIKQDVYGGYSDEGTADSNEVHISGNAVLKQDVYANFSSTGTTGMGTVSVSDTAQVKGTIYGGSGTDVIDINGGSVNAISADVGNDIILVNGGSVNYISGGSGNDIIGIDWYHTFGNIIIDQSTKGVDDNDILNIANAIETDFYINTDSSGYILMRNNDRTLTITGDISIRYVQKSELSFGDDFSTVASYNCDDNSLDGSFFVEQNLRITGNV